MSKRLISKKYIYVGSLGIAYFLLVKYTSFSLPCPFRYLSGYKCPGCGITTMLLALAEGNLQAAREAHLFLFYTWPWLTLLLIAFYSNTHPPHGRPKIYNFLLCLYLLACILFGVYRNYYNC